MDNRPVLFLDSGIGGLPYCHQFCIRNPGETVIYTADRGNFPYGTRGKDELIGLLTALVARLDAEFHPKLAVVACNTASVSAIDALRSAFPKIPWVGTVPAVKPAVTESRARHIGVLGTERTIEDPYIAELAAKYNGDCAVSGIAAPDLVRFVEAGGDTAGFSDQRRAVAPYIEAFRQKGADGIVLGCTHFLFLLDAFKAAAAPDIRIYDSVDGVSRRAESLLDLNGLRADDVLRNPADGPGNLLIVTGAAPLEKRWHERAAAFGLTLRLLDDETVLEKSIPEDAP
ncbi:glutamate racemase [Spirochaetia bacterium]|nr:glutamate racemase [Spirochaetia bacterium]